MNNFARGLDNGSVVSDSSYAPQRQVISLFVNTGDLSKKLYVCCQKEETTKNVCKIIANIYYKTFLSQGPSDDSDNDQDDTYYGKMDNPCVKVDQLEFNGFVLPAQHKIGEILDNKAQISAKIRVIGQGSQLDSKPKKISQSQKSAKKVQKPSKAASPAKTKKVSRKSENEIELLSDEILPGEMPPPRTPRRLSISAPLSIRTNASANQTVDDILESFSTKKIKTEDHEGVRVATKTSSKAQPTPKQTKQGQEPKKRGRPSNAQVPSQEPKTPSKKPQKKKADVEKALSDSSEDIYYGANSPKSAPKEARPTKKVNRKKKTENIEDGPTQVLPTLDMDDFPIVPKISIDHSQKSQQKNQKKPAQVKENSDEEDLLPPLKPKVNSQNLKKPEQKNGVKIDMGKGPNKLKPEFKKKDTFDYTSDSSSGSSVLVPSNKAPPKKKIKRAPSKKIGDGSSATSSDFELEKDLKTPVTKNVNLF